MTYQANQSEEADTLFQRIMNLPCNVPKGYAPGKADEAVYRIGHRDARHAAAELVAALPPQAKAEPAVVSEREAFQLITEVPSTDANDTVSAMYRALSRGHEREAQALARYYLGAKHAADRAILSAAPSTGVRNITAALSSPGVERLREWVEIGPVQRCALEQFLCVLGMEIPLKENGDAGR